MMSDLVYQISKILFIISHTLVTMPAMIFNGYLFYLAVRKSPKSMTAYTVLIANFALTDFLAAITDFFSQQRIIPTRDTVAYIAYGLCTHTGPYSCYVLYNCMLHCLTHSMWSLFISFSYRYWILRRPAPSRRQMVLLVLVFYMPSLLEFICLVYSYDPPSKIEAILRRQFPDYDFNNAMINGMTDILRFSCIYPIMHITLPVTPCYVCIFILRHKILAHLNASASMMSNETRLIHAQLLKVLTCQAMLPGFLFVGIGSYVLGQLELYNSPTLEFFSAICCMFVPLLSPITYIVFIKPYRIYTGRFYQRYVLRNKVSLRSPVTFAYQTEIGQSPSFYGRSSEKF